MDTQTWYKERVTERLLRYAVINTESKRGVDTTPSTAGQWDLLKMLLEELRDIGVSDADLNEHGYLIARIPASDPAYSSVPVTAFMAHVDTSEDVSGEGVNPQVIRNYDGGDIPLGTSSLVLSPADNPELNSCIGKDIITADGNTLLGADDKAGVAEIMTAVEFLLEQQPFPHGPVEIIFTPDEETGAGMDLFPREALRASSCYTLDGTGRGTLESECFHAVRIDAVCTGVSYHLGSARGRMVNAVSMAASLVNMLPQAESPEATDGRYGYYCALSVSGHVEKTELQIFIRDFDALEVERRIEAVRNCAAAVEAAYPGGKVSLEVTYQYRNMREDIDKEPRVLSLLEQAISAVGLTPEHTIIRGGTDGARLTAMGIPTPNIFTGGYNYHSRYEWASVDAMADASRVVVELIRLWAQVRKT